MTTVGYGDIKGTNTTERVFCIFLHLFGVLSYSFAAGSLTSILDNYDAINNKHQEKITILNRLYKENQLPSDLYYLHLNHIENLEKHHTQDDVKEFLDELPFRLKLKTIMYIYKDIYNKVDYLRS